MAERDDGLIEGPNGDLHAIPDGDDHALHRLDYRCGCNPDPLGDEPLLGIPPFLAHHPLGDEETD